MGDYLAKNDKFAVMVEKEQTRVKREVTDMFIAARKQKKMTQAKIAEIGGIKRPNITRFECGTYNPTVGMMVKMAACMGMKVEIRLVDK